MIGNDSDIGSGREFLGWYNIIQRADLHQKIGARRGILSSAASQASDSHQEAIIIFHRGKNVDQY
ncbi:hypothetical protein ACLUWI_00595 [Limosilactobacillus mucosae]|uniref:hypothetical protein n=1 Tax=Limosilactobacillus mucosae TaxID=97478 RepID=UPI0039952EB8